MFRYFTLLFVSVFAVVSITACNNTSEKTKRSVDSFDAENAEAHFSKLRAEKLVLSGQSVLDIDLLLTQISDVVSVTYNTVQFDEKAGATRLKDVKISATDKPDFGLSIDELALWGVNSEAITARIAGENLKDTASIAKRIEATDLEIFGMETIFAPFMNATNSLAENMLEEMGDDMDTPTPAQLINQYDAKMAKVILTDLSFHPWVLEMTDIPDLFVEKSSPAERETAQSLWHLFQKAAAISHSLTYENLAAYDGHYTMEMSQDGVDMDFAMTMPIIGQKDYMQGDLAYSYYRDVAYDMDMMMPSADGEMTPMKMEGTYGLYSLNDMRLSKVMDHLARGVMPARTDTDFMSLGVFRGEDVVVKMGGQELYKLENLHVDLSQFHWVVPELIEIKMDNLVYNIAGFMDFIGDTLNETEASGAEVEMMTKSISILERNGLGAPSIDFNMVINWNAESGAAIGTYGFGIDDFMRFKWDAAGELPDYNAMIKILPDDIKDVDEAAVADLFESKTRFRSYGVSLFDEGGLEKSFILATEFAALLPEEEQTPQTAFLRVNTPEQLRLMAGNSVLIAAPQVEKVFAPGVAYLQSLSNFINKGGSIAASVQPIEPMGAAEFEELDEVVKNDPAALVDILGLSVIHTPPE